MEPIEDILVRHACQTGWRVGPGNESGGGGGHVSGGWGEVGMRGGGGYKSDSRKDEDEPIVQMKFAASGSGKGLYTAVYRILAPSFQNRAQRPSSDNSSSGAGWEILSVPTKNVDEQSDRPIVIVSVHPTPSPAQSFTTRRPRRC